MKLPRPLLDRQFRLARRWSNREIQRLAPDLGGAVVNVSGWRDEDKEGGHYRDYFTAASSYSLTNWQGHSGFQGAADEVFLDLEAPLPEALHQAFDVVFNHTTLEHVFDVTRAFENLCAMSRDLVFLVVPVAQVQHENESFADYWRFTPSWAREAFRRQGLEPLHISTNNDRNAAVYLVVLASRHPERWRGKLPLADDHPQMAARWIGRSRWRQALQKLSGRIKR